MADTEAATLDLVNRVRGCDIFELTNGKISWKDAFRKVLDRQPRWTSLA